MESSVLFLGSVGAGKTQAIKSISEIEVVSTEVKATDAVAIIKASTTVSMDMGALRVGEQDKVVLYGAPGQERFDFMWDILLMQTQAVILLVNHAATDPTRELDFYVGQLRQRISKPRPVLIGISHVDRAIGTPMSIYQDYFMRRSPKCRCELCRPPVLRLDPRRSQDVKAILVAMVALIEMATRFPGKGCVA